MENLYKQLGFQSPDFVENHCGIRIYLGKKGENDWCVVVPRVLCELKSKSFKYGKDVAFYLISEKEALSIAKEYTELAKRMK